MAHCLKLAENCQVSPTAFCVGSILFLPASSSAYPALRNSFSCFNHDDTPAGLILAEGYSRQIPGNTHAEANALTNFRTKYADLVKVGHPGHHAMDEGTSTCVSVPAIHDVLKETECFATLEPCSVRTSGRPSCALDLVRAGVRAVYLVGVYHSYM